jgi:hypothetical protein
MIVVDQTPVFRSSFARISSGIGAKEAPKIPGLARRQNEATWEKIGIW